MIKWSNDGQFHAYVYILSHYPHFFRCHSRSVSRLRGTFSRRQNGAREGKTDAKSDKAHRPRRLDNFPRTLDSSRWFRFWLGETRAFQSVQLEKQEIRRSHRRHCRSGVEHSHRFGFRTDSSRLAGLCDGKRWRSRCDHRPHKPNARNFQFNSHSATRRVSAHFVYPSGTFCQSKKHFRPLRSRRSRFAYFYSRSHRKYRRVLAFYSDYRHNFLKI